MREIKIEIEMNMNQEIIMLNTNNSKSIKMSRDKMILNANDLYELLDYSIGNKYVVHSCIDENIDENKKKIFNNIVNTVEKIAEEISEIVFTDDNNE